MLSFCRLGVFWLRLLFWRLCGDVRLFGGGWMVGCEVARSQELNQMRARSLIEMPYERGEIKKVEVLAVD